MLASMGCTLMPFLLGSVSRTPSTRERHYVPPVVGHRGLMAKRSSGGEPALTTRPDRRLGQVRSATPGSSAKAELSVETTRRSLVAAVAAMIRSCAPRGLPVRRT